MIEKNPVGRPRYAGATLEMVLALKDEGYTYNQIAEKLDASLSLVRSRIKESGRKYNNKGVRIK